jgi:Brp/Blh family beta-carotene 15,15'-monooxygenase
MACVHALALSLIALAAAGVDFGGNAALTVASLCILTFGFPHGAFDLALIRSDWDRIGGGAILPMYIGAAASMAALWWAAPVLALAVFLAIAIIHFSEDWDDTGSTFLSTGVALALIAAPALLHRVEVADIFVALTGTRQASLLADGLLFSAPVGLAVAVAAILALCLERRFGTAASAATSLAALICLPPAVGFAVFFCAFHSPRHLGQAVRTLGLTRSSQWIRIAAPTMMGALALVAVLYTVRQQLPTGLGLTSTTFMALSILTIPHMLVPRLAAALAQRSRSAARQPAFDIGAQRPPHLDRSDRLLH